MSMKFKFAEWIKENNQYYLPEENLLDGDWFLSKMPKQLQEYVIKANEMDWRNGIEYNELLVVLESEMDFFLHSGIYNLSENEKCYLEDFLAFCRTNGWQEAFGDEPMIF